METTRVREASVKYGRRVGSPTRLSTTAGVVAHVRRIVDGDDREHFIAIYLDARHVALGWSVVSIGTASASLVHPREVFRTAIALGASALIVAHNHPSGDPSPSAEDRAVTKRLADAGALLGITLVDSVVVGDTSYRSLHEDGVV